MEDGTDEVAGEMDHRRDKEAEVSEEIVNQSLGASSSIPYDDTDAQKDDEVQSSGNDHEMEDRTDGVAEEMDHRQDEAEVSEEIEEAEVSQEMDVGPSGEIDDRRDEGAEPSDEEEERSDEEKEPSDEEKEPSEEPSDEEEELSDEEDESSKQMEVEPTSQKPPPVIKRKLPSHQRPRKRRCVSKKEVEDDALEDDSPEDEPFQSKVGTRVNPIDVDLFVSKWEPVTAKEIVSMFHISFSVISSFL
jgi:hypothetical protein